MTTNNIVLPHDLDGGWTPAQLREAARQVESGMHNLPMGALPFLLDRIADTMDEVNPPPMTEPREVGAVVYAQVVKSLGAFQRMLKFSDTRTRCWINNWGDTYSWDMLINPHE